MRWIFCFSLSCLTVHSPLALIGPVHIRQVIDTLVYLDWRAEFKNAVKICRIASFTTCFGWLDWFIQHQMHQKLIQYVSRRYSSTEVCVQVSLGNMRKSKVFLFFDGVKLKLESIDANGKCIRKWWAPTRYPIGFNQVKHCRQVGAHRSPGS